MKILLTGGHLTPAIAFLQYLSTTSHTAVFVGRPHTHEETEVTRLGYSFIPFSTPKISRYRLLASLVSLPRLCLTVSQAGVILDREKPHAVLTFGGYVSAPVSIAAFRRRVPVIVHEQTAVAGLANEMVGRYFARAVALSYPLSRRYFPAGKCRVTGNLLRREIFSNSLPVPAWLPVPTRPILYATGGNQGSLALNRAVSWLYARWGTDHCIIHQTGDNGEPGSYATMNSLREALPPAVRANVIVKPWFTAAETAWVLQHASVVISRAGANTVSEVMACGVPGIFIPLPKTHHDEQGVHARLIQAAGGGMVINQSQLTAASLSQTLTRLETDYEQFCQGMRRLKAHVHPAAAKAVMDLIDTYA